MSLDKRRNQVNKKQRSEILGKFRTGRLKRDGIGDGIEFFIKHYRFNGDTLELYHRSGPKGPNGEPFKPPFTPATKGGETICILAKDGETLAIGKSVCHGLKSHEEAADAFSYKIGAHIALGRALQKLVA